MGLNHSRIASYFGYCQNQLEIIELMEFEGFNLIENVQCLKVKFD